MSNSVFGIVGLGVMGKSLALNLAEKKHDISVYNRTGAGEAHVVKSFLEDNATFKNIKGFTDLSEYVQSLKKPRKILLMIKAGFVTDQVINTLQPLLTKGDIIIDGGNSHYQDSNRRREFLQSKGLRFIGCGISGGEEGARLGPSLMPGGTRETYALVSPILESIAAKDVHGKPCCAFIGPDGAGHFVKMIHNGIEYVEMQLLAELYAIISHTRNYKEIVEVFSKWNNGNLSSYLLEITSHIFQKKEGKQYLLDVVLDAAGNKGTGSWSSKTAFDLGTVNTMMSSAVFARYLSSFKDKRVALSEYSNKNSASKKQIDLKNLENAYRFARIINHHQGFELMKEASVKYKWNLKLSEIARIWTNGCIIKSNFMNELIAVYKEHDDILSHLPTLNTLSRNEKDIEEILHYGLQNRIALDTFSSALNYWIAMTTKNLPANLIQAQRDYFGAHTYQRTDDTSNRFFHTNWAKK